MSSPRGWEDFSREELLTALECAEYAQDLSAVLGVENEILRRCGFGPFAAGAVYPLEARRAMYQWIGTR